MNDLSAALRSDPAVVEMMMDAWDASEEFEVGGYSYPRQYALARALRPPRAAVAKMRRAVGKIPRVNPADYDILFNSEQGTWDVVKWIRSPKWIGYLPGLGMVIGLVREPYSVYFIGASRSPSSLGERDWELMRRNSITLRSPDALTAELLGRAMEKRRDEQRRREDADRDFASYYRDLFKRSAQELGI